MNRLDEVSIALQYDIDKEIIESMLRLAVPTWEPRSPSIEDLISVLDVAEL